MTKKVLVIDDDPSLVTYLKALLEDNGYGVITAKDGEEGLEKVKGEKPDIITLDLLMPEKTGIKMFRELRRDNVLKDIPIIMVTGISNEYQGFSDFKKFIYERKIPGPEGYIEKPIKPEALLSKIDEILNK
ncbi:MAG: response regulator [Thermodesulfobacteriota bacterium]|nr:response regulator [Thermodesulfobacteriota bacterium]